MYSVEAIGLTKTYADLVAVDQINLRIEPGTLFGFIGPNGAGKSTTLRMLAGLLEPTDGTIRLQGQDIEANHDATRWLVGYMPDFFGVYDNMMVWEYLDFFARCYALSTERRAGLIPELLDLVDLNHKRDDYVENLSRGMRQRLCLAHTLVHDPEILLLDEPASGLDPRARVEIRELLRELQKMGKTIIISSHILSELSEMCDQIGIIERGQLLVTGTLDEVRRHLRHEKTIRLKIISDLEPAETLLSTFPGVSDVFQITGGLEADFVGDDALTADLLAHMINNDVRITNFTEDVTNLEDVFLQITEGNVQ